MTDEMDEIEALNAVRNMAKMAWALYEGLQEEGFSQLDALALVGRWLHGTGGGKSA